MPGDGAPTLPAEPVYGAADLLCGTPARPSTAFGTDPTAFRTDGRAAAGFAIEPGVGRRDEGVDAFGTPTAEGWLRPGIPRESTAFGIETPGVPAIRGPGAALPAGTVAAGPAPPAVPREGTPLTNPADATLGRASARNAVGLPPTSETGVGRYTTKPSRPRSIRSTRTGLSTLSGNGSTRALGISERVLDATVS